MVANKNYTINIFAGIAVAILLVILISIPVLAGISNDPVNISSSLQISTPNPWSAGNNTNVSLNQQTHSQNSVGDAINNFFIGNTLSITDTLTPTYTPTSTPTPRSTSFSYLPNLYRNFFIPTNTPTPTLTPTATPPPPETVLFCDSIGNPISIPDDNDAGISDSININDSRKLVNLSLYLDITHSWVGDLVVMLTNENTGKTVVAVDRPGVAPYYCSENDIVAILDDKAAQGVDYKCASSPAAVSGIYLPSDSFSQFIGSSASASWELNVSDHYQYDTGTLDHWCLKTELSQTMPAPTPSPTPVSLPSSASVAGMSGEDQLLNLDCESRSAVDWARHFGYSLDELSFLYNLPESDDPEAGFVGNPDGIWGNIPPNDYGVHAPPVAALLRDYGLQASARKYLKWDDLRAEIASGNPAIVWIIGGGSYSLANGIPHLYIPNSTHQLTVTARHEHTVILVGYSPDSVTVLNGYRFIDIDLTEFLDSWSALQFMAVVARP